MKKIVVVLLVVVLTMSVLLATGCGKSEEDKEPAATPSSSTPSSSNSLAQTSYRAGPSFDINLFNTVVAEEPGKNVFISPVSARIALAMTYNGAEGKTRDEMAKVLKFEGMTLDEVNEALRAKKDSLQSVDPRVTLEMANSLWGKQGICFIEAFIQRNKEYYGAGVFEFTGPDPGPINTWVNEKTHGKIPTILKKPIDSLTILFLINAIYFNGEWTMKFDKDLTEDKDFALLDGGKKKVPMMSQSSEYMYHETDLFQAVKLPYGDEGRVSMYLFLPKEGVGLEGLYGELNQENFTRWMSGFSERPGDINVPRFKIEYKKELKETLLALGMVEAFDEGLANFSGMVPNGMVDGMNVYIARVLQKSFIEVDEEGTEATAATVVEMKMMRDAPETEPPERFQMFVDRPFFFVIKDNRSGSLLFMGSVVDPGT